MDEILSVNFAAAIKPTKPINDEMTLCKCYILALGKNANKSSISKEATEDALETLYNIPVVGHIYVDNEGNYVMGGHDVELIKTEDGKFKFKKLTVPYGVVPKQDDVHFEEVKEADGKVKTYLVADVILWTGRYPQLLECNYNEDVYFNQSMEIKVVSSDFDKGEGVTNISKFIFSALCLLGKSDDIEKNVAPCFPSSKVEPYQFSATEEWQTLFEEFSRKVAEVYGTVKIEKGGKIAMNAETITSILAEFGLEKVEDCKFEITKDMTEEEMRSKLSEQFTDNGNSGEGEPNGNPEGNGENNDDGQPSGVAQPEAKFQLEPTYQEKLCKINDELARLSVWSSHECKSYDLCDFDDTYVYARYRFETEGKIEKGFKRIAYSIAEDGKLVLNDETEIDVRLCWLTKEDEEKVKQHEEAYKALEDYKTCKEEEERKAKFAEIVKEFADLSDIEEYKQIVGNALSFENEDAFKEKLYAVRGKFGRTAMKSVDGVRIPTGNLNNGEEKSEEYKFFEKYYPEAIKNKN